MESDLSPDKKIRPPVPIKTYQWEDLRKDREAGCYPWTHLLKVPLEGEITGEDIIRETTPRRSMSREFSRSRTRSPVDRDVQKILNLDSSPGSSRKHADEGEDAGIQIPNFSKEISVDSEDDAINQAVDAYMVSRPESHNSSSLGAPVEIPKNVSPKSILKRRVPEQQYVCVTETREKTKCCHPLVNKIKHLADKTLSKLEKSENEKSPLMKRKKTEEIQEIRQLKTSPGAVRRQKFGAIKLGSSDEMSKTLCIETPPPRKKKDHIYEDIEEKNTETEKVLNFAPEVEKSDYKKTEFEKRSDSNKETESYSEKKSNASQDPSLVTEDTTSLKAEEHVMEKLHQKDDVNKEAMLLDEEMDPDEPNVDEIFQNQLDETRPKNDSPNITITEIIDDETEYTGEPSTIPIETSPSPSPRQTERQRKEIESEWSKPNRWTSEGGTPIEKPVRPTREGSVQVYTPDVRCACQFFQSDSLLPERVNPVGTRPTSRASNIISYESDHEYEIIEKPPPNVVYNVPNLNEKATMVKTDDELSSTTSLERKYLQHTSDEDDQMEDKENLKIGKHEGITDAEALQKDIESRFFVNTPSTVSRTECDLSTSQVDSSALENLPLKRDSRPKNGESIDSKIQQRIREGTGKLKTQAGKLKTKLQSMKSKQFSMPERPKIRFPERPKFKMPEAPKITFPDRPRFSLPDRRKFSLPDRPKFKKINISEKLNLGDRKKFTMPERPKFNVPDMPKFKMPERPKINFPSLGKKKEYKVETNTTGSVSDLKNVATVDFDAKTYPRLFGRKKKSELPKTSSSPTLNRDDTPPPTFTFTRMKKSKQEPSSYIPDSPEQPREYGNIEGDASYESEMGERKQFNTTYDFDKLNTDDFMDKPEPSNYNKYNSASIPDISPSKQEYTHVINEIDNDEFFVRPKGISRENIQVREYLSDEIRQAFKIPMNVLASMGSSTRVNDDNVYVNEPEDDPELMVDDNDEPIRYSTEDLNDKDDGYYTFPPVRPSRAKRKKKESDPIQYIDESVNVSMQFSEVDLGLPEDHEINIMMYNENADKNEPENQLDFPPLSDLHSIHEYANDDMIEYPENVVIQSQTLPMPPKRKKKIEQSDYRHSSMNDFNNILQGNLWEEPPVREDIIVYRTEHEYVVPQTEATVTEQSPKPPRRNRSRSSRGTSLCDDDRTSHGAESLTLDTHLPHTEDIIQDMVERAVNQESPGYATVDKTIYPPSKGVRRSKSKTPPVRRRKSNSSERKYYTVGASKTALPDRPPRKKSSTSLMTLDSFMKRSVSADLTQYVEIDEPQHEEVHKDLESGEVLSKMKDRPLPPPPRPPRGSKKEKKKKSQNTEFGDDFKIEATITSEMSPDYCKYQQTSDEIVEIEVSTQTDPLPDDVDFELGIDEHLDISMSSSLRDIVDDDMLRSKSHSKAAESPRFSRPTSRSEKSFKLSDPKISELSKPNVGRTSPTVILVERRVSSPTRINEREEILTEASLTVQHIDIDESKIPDLPPLPKSRNVLTEPKSSKIIVPSSDERALERVSEASRDIQLDNLVTQRLQVRDLDVGRLNVSELQASKILVSDIEGMTLQVTELDSKSGHISVSGIEFSQSVIDEIVKKFAEITTTHAASVQSHDATDYQRPESRSEQTQTEVPEPEVKVETKTSLVEDVSHTPSSSIRAEEQTQPPPPPPRPVGTDDTAVPPQRPPPPDLTPLLYSYLQDITLPTATFYANRSLRERPFTEFHESQHQTPPPPTRRAKRKPAAPHTESSSDDSRPRPSPRRMPPIRAHEPTITEAGALFFRVCHNSISRTMRNIFHTFMSYISGTEDKKDMQMALVIFLVLIAGLIMFGLSDSRTIHHHHWEFFNPPDTKQ